MTVGSFFLYEKDKKASDSFGFSPVSLYLCAKMKKLLVLLLMLTCCLTRSSGYNYRPSGRAFVCVNGDNRLTRTLYGSSADYRLQTSDRPFFVVFQNSDYRSLSFRVNGVDLEKADYCLSRYQDGMRYYEVRHASWGKKAVLRMKVVVGQQTDRVVWRLRVMNFDGPVKLELPHQQASLQFTEDQYINCSGLTFSLLTTRQGEVLFDQMENDMQQLASSVTVRTPDPYINTLGNALSVVREKVKNVSVEDLLWHFRYDADRDAMRRLWPSIEEYLQSVGTDSISTPHLTKCYWANTMAANVAAFINKDGSSYYSKADEAFMLLNQHLWMHDKGCWAEFKDQKGLKRQHTSPALWSIYMPIDYDACSPEQAYQATKYMSREMPHIPVTSDLSTLATSNWMPYTWDMNNVTPVSGLRAAIAYFKAGRNEEGFRLMKANIIDQLYDGDAPANFGLSSKHDVVNGEQGRDMADCISIAERTLVEGLFGIRPDAFMGRCLLHPGFPESWDSASIHTPYIDFRYRRQGNLLVYDVTQHFSSPQQLVLRVNLGLGRFRDIEGTSEAHQVFAVEAPLKFPEVYVYSSYEEEAPQTQGTDEPTFEGKFEKIKLEPYYNAAVTDISPEVMDTVFRKNIIKDEFLMMGVPFQTPIEGKNIICTSLSERYPDKVTIPLNERASRAWLMLAGTTNTRESRMVNGLIIARYQEGGADTLKLVNPDNWCPIEQDYYIDDYAFYAPQPRPYRVSLGTGVVSRNLSKALGIKGTSDLQLPGGAAQMLCLSLDPEKKLIAIDICPQSNDIVVGLMALTLQ